MSAVTTQTLGRLAGAVRQGPRTRTGPRLAPGRPIRFGKALGPVLLLAVWSAEAFNTAIESTCNLLSPQFNEHVRIAKDLGAGAVLLISIGAFAIGLLTFWPYLVTGLPPTPDPNRPTTALYRAGP